MTERRDDDAPAPRPGDPPADTIPIKLGDVTVGWAVEEVARRLADAPHSYLLIAPAPPPVLAVRAARRGFILIPQHTITYISSLGGVVTVYVDGARYWRDGSLRDTEGRLDSRLFHRLDQSHLINLARLAEITPWTHQRWKLIFADAQKSELLVSRDVGRRLRAALGW